MLQKGFPWAVSVLQPLSAAGSPGSSTDPDKEDGECCPHFPPPLAFTIRGRASGEAQYGTEIPLRCICPSLWPSAHIWIARGSCCHALWAPRAMDKRHCFKKEIHGQSGEEGLLMEASHQGVVQWGSCPCALRGS